MNQTPLSKLAFNHDSFKRLKEEVEVLQDLVLRLNARLALQEAPTKEEKKEEPRPAPRRKAPVKK